METIEINNKLKINYIYNEKKITSFSIGFDAGALNEEGYPLGTAHVLEHMLFKRTKNRDEAEISSAIDRYFGFSNAMTNYPYAIYYGSLQPEDFEKCLDIYSDIIKFPVFLEKELKEEIKIIKEELREWKDDNDKFLEDEAFYNSFKNRRIKYPIIGQEEQLDLIDTSALNSFYDKFYIPSNCIITISTNINKETAIGLIEKYFSDNNKKSKSKIDINYEKNIPGIFIKNDLKLNGAKIKYLFDISVLDKEEIFALKVFDYLFGRTGYGILYNQIRTKEALCYDINTEIKNEKGIKLYSINVNVLKESIDKTIEIINSLIEEVKPKEYKTEEIKKSIEKISFFKAIRHEKSVLLCNDITTDILMGIDDNIYNIDSNKIRDTIKKVLKDGTIQIIC
ncbi:MAG: insulinase family protein [Bacillota bacterium]|nr:insulinase family protein [Bacillota bacterium]